MVHVFDITVPDLTGEEPRKAYVYLPPMCRTEPEARFPVLYMFDGHNVFFDEDATYGKSWGMAEYLDATQTPLIVAAVECNHSPDHGRLQEYSPFNFRDPRLGWIEGRGRETMEWLIRTFKPEIDESFPTLPDRGHTWIGGSSMGGLMSLYAVLTYNQVFSGAAALSPSLWFAVRQLDQMIRNAEIQPDTVIYMDYGSRELGFHPNMARQFSRVVHQLLEKRAMLNCRIVPGGDHCEASWERQIPFFINALLYGRL